MDFIQKKEVRIDKVPEHITAGITLHVLREDELHKYVSGNKFRKMKYNILKAKSLGLNRILSFGGAYSNHISAVAASGAILGMETIGVIRGDELSGKEYNPTLAFAASCGMKFHWVSREQYRQRHNPEFLKTLIDIYGDQTYILPEGGTNHLAVEGCKEILSSKTDCYDAICLAVGTGGTLSGVSISAQEHQHVYGFPALKGDFLSDDIRKYTSRENWTLISDYHFGGYAKVSDELVYFLNAFYEQTQIPLDPIYTGKMMYGVMDMIKNRYFSQRSKILAIHTGGLQGIKGLNQLRKQKNKITLNYE